MIPAMPILVNYRDQLENIRLQTNDRLPNARTKDEFDHETGEPNIYRIRPRPSKSQMYGDSIGQLKKIYKISVPQIGAGELSWANNFTKYWA
jgi:hypothetical protein